MSRSSLSDGQGQQTLAQGDREKRMGLPVSPQVYVCIIIVLAIIAMGASDSEKKMLYGRENVQTGNYGVPRARSVIERQRLWPNHRLALSASSFSLPFRFPHNFSV